jgi:toxin ParE1/3/4
MAHRLAAQVVSELDEIWYYIARESDSMDIADRFVKFITDRFLLIADLRAGLRSFPVGQYLVLDRVVGEDVLILHVTHGRRNLEVLFGQ